MPDTARYGAWAGGYGILIALVGAVLTIIGKAHAILMICLDVLAGVFFLVCGIVSYTAETSSPKKNDCWSVTLIMDPAI